MMKSQARRTILEVFGTMFENSSTCKDHSLFACLVRGCEDDIGNLWVVEEEVASLVERSQRCCFGNALVLDSASDINGPLFEARVSG